MLRGVVAALLAANLVYWGWARGWLPPGWLPLPAGGEEQREPQRLAAQLRPQAIRLQGEPGADAPARCLQAGPFDAAAWPEAEAAVLRAGLDAGRWQRVPVAADDAAGRAWLRVPAADAAQQSALGAEFRPCD